MTDKQPIHSDVTRRDFLKVSTATAASVGAAATVVGNSASPLLASPQLQKPKHRALVKFTGPDSLFHGHGWESLNPGYWQIKNNALRRRLTNVGDRARRTGFPFHSESKGQVMQTEYDPSLPSGILYRTDWKMTGSFTVTAKFTYKGDRLQPADGDDPQWKMFQPGYGQFGIAVGGKSLFESYNKIRNAVKAVWVDEGKFQITAPKNKQRNANGAKDKTGTQTFDSPALNPGDEISFKLTVTQQDKVTKIDARLDFTTADGQGRLQASSVVAKGATDGYLGIVGQGLVDFEVNAVLIEGGDNLQITPQPTDCYSCYALGDTLKQSGDDWNVRFVSLFASDGKRAEIRISDVSNPTGGWKNVPVAGSAPIVSNTWRRNTSVITATLPRNPAETTLYYTVWKDGKDVTADPRIGSDTVGPGTGMVGDVPTSGQYVGRLPQLVAPYRMCGLSCHAINQGLQQRTPTGFKMTGAQTDWQIRDQPTVEAYKHLDDYDFQVMVWEDDVWYMELVLYPPSTDDAFKVITTSIGGPTSRWQMMRHWNVINPGDHDYGMDDVKGPEQLAIRTVPGLGQDIEYMQRNFQIVHHLTTGDEIVDPVANPKKWRAWKMPNRDFTFAVLDSRLWRSSQDVDMWDDSGWGKFKSLYDRTDPTRSLLGEEQFGWLQELLATDSSRLICLTGLNGLHTIWGGGKGKDESDNHPKNFSQRDRVTADYAGWVKAGADRVLELLGSREGVVSVYGDVHNGCIMTNDEHNVIECSFGPIGRSGGRAVIPGFGPKMKDVDDRNVTIHALYHKSYSNPSLAKHPANSPFYWNFLEMDFDPTRPDPTIGLRIRNLIDAPQENARGGGSLETVASSTGRSPESQLPSITLLPNADVRIADSNGRPIRGTRSLANGKVLGCGLPDIKPGTKVIATAFDGQQSKSIVVTTVE